MTANPKLLEVLRKSDEHREIFEGLNISEEVFVRTLVERDSPILAAKVSGVSAQFSGGYSAHTIIERLCARQDVRNAIVAYGREWVERPKKVLTLQNIISDLSDLYDLALSHAEYRIALEAKRIQLSILRSHLANKAGEPKA